MMSLSSRVGVVSSFPDQTWDVSVYQSDRSSYGCVITLGHDLVQIPCLLVDGRFVGALAVPRSLDLLLGGSIYASLDLFLVGIHIPLVCFPCGLIVKVLA